MRHEFEVILGLVLLFIIFIILAVWTLTWGMLLPALNSAYNVTPNLNPTITNQLKYGNINSMIGTIMGIIFLLCGVGTLIAILFLAFSKQPENYEDQYYQEQYNNRGMV